MSASIVCIGRRLTYVHRLLEAIEAAIAGDMAQWGTKILERGEAVRRESGEWAVTIRFDRLD
jgi:hypothetical protein